MSVRFRGTESLSILGNNTDKGTLFRLLYKSRKFKYIIVKFNRIELYYYDNKKSAPLKSWHLMTVKSAEWPKH